MRCFYVVWVSLVFGICVLLIRVLIFLGGV